MGRPPAWPPSTSHTRAARHSPIQEPCPRAVPSSPAQTCSARAVTHLTTQRDNLFSLSSSRGSRLGGRFEPAQQSKRGGWGCCCCAGGCHLCWQCGADHPAEGRPHPPQQCHLGLTGYACVCSSGTHNCMQPEHGHDQRKLLWQETWAFMSHALPSREHMLTEYVESADAYIVW